MKGQSDPAAEDALSLLTLARILIGSLRRLAMVSLAVGGATVVLLLFQQRQWTSEMSFAVSGGDDRQSSLRSLAGQFGVALPTSGDSPLRSPEFYSDLLESRAILEPIANGAYPTKEGGAPSPLRVFLEIDEADSALALEQVIEALRGAVRPVVSRTTGVITARVTLTDPVVARSIGLSLLLRLNEFNLTLRQIQASQERRFTEERVQHQREVVGGAEERIARFLRTNREYRSSPDLVIEHDRLQRDVALQQQVLVGLAQSLEEARIREVRDVPVIATIQSPSAPAMPDSRGLAAKAFFAVVASFLVYSAWLIAVHVVQERRRAGDPAVIALLSTLSALRPSRRRDE